MRKILGLAFLLATSAVFAAAQTPATHTAVLTWVDGNNPAGVTYSVYRAPGLCSGTPTFSKLANGITGLTYSDATVTPGNYCFQVTATLVGIESAASNSAQATVPPFVVTQVSVTVK